MTQEISDKAIDEWMLPLSDARKEAFARALACGFTAKAAALEAGYSNKGSRTYQRAAREEIKGRAAQIARTLPWSGTSDLAPVIDKLVAVTDACLKTGTASALATAVRALAEVARLKRLLPRASMLGPLPPEMSEEEWLAEYGQPGD